GPGLRTPRVRRSRPAGGGAAYPPTPRLARSWLPYVPAGGLRMIPGATWGPIPGPDVAQAPANLGADPPPPVGAGAGHLAAGQRLRDAVRTRVGVACVLVPAALPVPEPVQVPELLADRPVETGHHPASDAAGVIGPRVGGQHQAVPGDAGRADQADRAGRANRAGRADRAGRAGPSLLDGRAGRGVSRVRRGRRPG